SSAATNIEVASYDAIQLWAYAYASNKIHTEHSGKNIVLGYVVLDDASESNLLTSDEDLAAKIKSQKICSIHRFKEPFPEKLNEAQEMMVALTKAIATENEFSARPRKNGTCTFCELNKVCVKSEIIH